MYFTYFVCSPKYEPTLDTFDDLKFSSPGIFESETCGSYLGMVARAKVQQRSVHITDIQQNMEIPA